MTERPSTPFGKADPTVIAEFWRQFCAETGMDTDLAPPEAWPFGDSQELADELLALVLIGTKRATAGSVAEYESEEARIPQAGDLEIVTDGAMTPKVVIRLTDVRIGPLSSVDDQFAYDEEEGDRTRRYWLDTHTKIFRRVHSDLGIEFAPEMATISQRFVVVYRDDRSASDD